MTTNRNSLSFVGDYEARHPLVGGSTAPKTRPSRAPFNAWLARVDRALYARCGMGHDDLPDQCWRDWFDSGMTPVEAADECLDNEGFFDTQDYRDGE